MRKGILLALALLAGFTLSPAGVLAQPAPAAPSSGLRITVAVEAFTGAEVLGGQVGADAPTAMLTEVLLSDGRFVLVERAALTGLQTEQQLGQGGSSVRETAPATGRMIGAGYLIRGAITAYNPSAGGGGLRLSGVPGGSARGLGAGLQARKATVTVTLRIIDVSTGQVISSASAEGVATSRDADAGVVDFNKGATVGFNALKATSTGKALDAAIRKALASLRIDNASTPWTGLVVDVRGDSVIVNAGADQNVGPGMVFGVYRRGEALTDPGTGEVLDVDIQRLGSIRVESVREKISIARIIDGQSPSRGDLLKAE